MPMHISRHQFKLDEASDPGGYKVDGHGFVLFVWNTFIMHVFACVS